MKVRQAVDDDDVPLTQRETQVLRHVALGLSNKEIGRSLEISVETVKEHVQNILRKIAVSDRTQAAVWAVRKGLGVKCAELFYASGLTALQHCWTSQQWHATCQTSAGRGTRCVAGDGPFRRRARSRAVLTCV